MKINIDGSSKINSGILGCGGFIYNENGVWLGGLICSLGSCSPFMVEVKGALHSLKSVWQVDFTQLFLESDSKSLVDALADNKITSLIFRVLTLCKNLLVWDWKVSICHTWWCN